jgi:hypothetical protein
MNRLLLALALLAFAGAFGCWMAYARIGSYVDAQGFLHEPFGLIPLGYLLGFAGIVLLVLARVFRPKNKAGLGARPCWKDFQLL